MAEAVGELQGPSAATEPDGGDGLQAASELLQAATVCGRHRSSSGGDGLRAAPEFLGRRLFANSTGVLRMEAEIAVGGGAFGMRSVFFAL